MRSASVACDSIYERRMRVLEHVFPFWFRCSIVVSFFGVLRARILLDLRVSGRSNGSALVLEDPGWKSRNREQVYGSLNNTSSVRAP